MNVNTFMLFALFISIAEATKCSEVLQQIALCAPTANAVTKGIVFETTRRPRPDALDFASRGFAACMLSAEGREGVSAFVEKRKPKWAID